MKYILIIILISSLLFITYLAVRLIIPHQVRLLLGSDVEIIMTCYEPLITGDGLCLPEGHTYQGVYEEWVD